MKENSTSKRQSSIDRRGQITAAALDCLIEHGFRPGPSSCGGVARGRRISLGHLTYHFASMDEVLVETYRKVAERLKLTAPQSAPSGMPTERLTQFLQSVYAPETLTPENIRLRVDLVQWPYANPADGNAGLRRA
ncbi:MAG: hypothetical protein U5N55_05330 [Cypionkella sp.]|nr:hypothetical protein [Cypionkella sp.]